MHVDDFGDLPESQRLQVLDPFFEEVALPVDDEVHHLQHGLPALLDRLQHPVGVVQLVRDELLVLAFELRLIPGDLAVGARQPQTRKCGVVVEDDVVVVDLLDDEVGNDVVAFAGRILQPRLGIELGDLIRCRLHL